jgi:hypothetical protein
VSGPDISSVAEEAEQRVASRRSKWLTRGWRKDPDQPLAEYVEADCVDGSSWVLIILQRPRIASPGSASAAAAFVGERSTVDDLYRLRQFRTPWGLSPGPRVRPRLSR